MLFSFGSKLNLLLGIQFRCIIYGNGKSNSAKGQQDECIVWDKARGVRMENSNQLDCPMID
jgi:hypothetical protein